MFQAKSNNQEIPERVFRQLYTIIIYHKFIHRLFIAVMVAGTGVGTKSHSLLEHTKSPVPWDGALYLKSESSYDTRVDGLNVQEARI